MDSFTDMFQKIIQGFQEYIIKCRKLFSMCSWRVVFFNSLSNATGSLPWKNVDLQTRFAA